MVEPRFNASPDRYECGMEYKRCGRSGIKLSRISLGLWHNFGANVPYSRSKKVLLHAFDKGIVSMDLANNYGPPYGTAEETFGRIMDESLRPYRDELFVSTKAGYDMWPGPYGEWGSRKYLFASLNQSLRRMRLEYVDVFYSHRFDPETPMEETLQALVDIVRCGKALYAGISRWPLDAMEFAAKYLAERDVPCLLFQDRLNLLDRHPVDDGLTDFVQARGIGFIVFSALAQGILSDKYLNGIPEGSRAFRGDNLKASSLTPELLAKVRSLNEIALERGETLARMATAWVLEHPAVTSVIAGSSSIEQLDDTLLALQSPAFTAEQLERIDRIVSAK